MKERLHSLLFAYKVIFYFYVLFNLNHSFKFLFFVYTIKKRMRLESIGTLSTHEYRATSHTCSNKNISAVRRERTTNIKNKFIFNNESKVVYLFLTNDTQYLYR